MSVAIGELPAVTQSQDFDAQNVAAIEAQRWSLSMRVRAAGVAALTLVTTGLAGCTSAGNGPNPNHTSATSTAPAPIPDKIYADCLKWDRASQAQIGGLRQSLISLASTKMVGKLSPGVTMEVGCGSKAITSVGVGYIDDEKVPSHLASPETTEYDLASISKMITAVSVFMLANQGKLGPKGIDTPVGDFLPEYQQDLNDPTNLKYQVTFRMLMQHRSGLVDVKYSQLAGPENDSSKNLPPDVVMENILKAPLKNAPDTEFSYSNEGYNVIFAAASKAAGEPLDVFTERELLIPLAGSSTNLISNYKDNHDTPSLTNCAPTSPDYNQRIVIRCIPQDYLGRSLNNIAGHDGWFATANTLGGRFAAMLANNGVLDGHRYITPNNIVTMSTVQPDHLKNSPYGAGARINSTGIFGGKMSPGTFGHSGATGTRIGIDEQTGLWADMLDNSKYKNIGGSPKISYVYQQETNALVTATNALP